MRSIATATVRKAPAASAPAALLQRKCACGSGMATGECTQCQQEDALLQRAAPSTQRRNEVPNSIPPIVHEVLRAPGRPLDGATRGFMESRFAHDFGDVRVHTDAKAGESARAVGALAYTVGHDVVFDTPHYAPRTPGGRRLVAHELVHVMQQSSGAVPRPASGLSLSRHGDPDEREADALSTAAESGPVHSRARASAPRLARVSFGESIARFFGGGTFTDVELQAYLRFLDLQDRIEDQYDSDNKARAVVAKWKAGDQRFFLPVTRKRLLIEEMMSDFTGDDDEQAILDLLRGSSDAEIDTILTAIGEANLVGEFHTAERDQLDAFLAEYHTRRGHAATATRATPAAAAAAAQPVIERIVVNQEVTQTVTIHWSDGRQESDICSTGKGQCCVDPQQPGSDVSESDTRAGGSAWTPVGDHTVALKMPETPSGVKLWTEFVDPRDIALHYYRPVDGTPLSHGCVRLNWEMAQKIYDGSVAADDPRVRRRRLAATRVRVVGLPRPRCDYPMLQREWAGDFAMAGTRPPDGDTPELRRERTHIAHTRRQLRGALDVTDAELDALIRRLRTETGGLPTSLSGAARATTLQAVAAVGAAIPRCGPQPPTAPEGAAPTGRRPAVRRKALGSATPGVMAVAALAASHVSRRPGSAVEATVLGDLAPHVRLGHGSASRAASDQEATARGVESSVLRAQPDRHAASDRAAARLHHDFGTVRIHTDEYAATMAGALNAAAYTIGNHIAFARGRFAPSTREGRALIAHELTHVYQQGAVATHGNGVQRRVAANYAQIEDRLSYGIFDWAITDREAHEVLEMLNGLSDQDLADTVAAMDRDGLVERLLDNVADTDRERHAVLIARITRRRSVARSVERIIDRLSYGVFDWAITDQDARDALQVLLGLEPQQLRTVVGRLVNARVFDRLMENLPEEDQRRFAAFIGRLRRIRDEFTALVAAHVAFLHSRPGGAGRTVRERVETTGYGGSRSTWDDLDLETQRDWRRRAREAISAVIASLRGTELEPIVVRSELVFVPEEAERLNAYAYVSGGNRLYFGRSWVIDAEENVRDVWQSIAHELGGHEEFGSTWSWEIMRAAVAGLTPEERAEALGSAHSLYSAYGYLETEIYAELRELPHRIETSGGDQPHMDVRRQLGRLRDAFGPTVARQIALRLYYRILDDPRVAVSARRLLYDAVQEIFGLFPIAEAIAP